MCFRSDLRGDAPTGLDKPARVSSISSPPPKTEPRSSALGPKTKSKGSKSQSKAEESSKNPSKEQNDDEYGESYELSLAAKRRKREERLKEEFPDYDGSKMRKTGMVQGNLGGSVGGGAGMAMSGGF